MKIFIPTPLNPITDHIKKNKKLRKITFEFDGAIVDGHADMEGSWGSWENELLGNTIINLVKENKNLEIAIRFSEFKNE